MTRRLGSFLLITAFVFTGSHAGSAQTANSPDKKSGTAADDADEPVFDMGPGITPPRVTHQVSPSRPESEGFRISGSVIIGLVVSSHGEPKSVHVIKSLDKEIDQSAVDAVRQWGFEPAKKDGKPVAVRVSVEVRFHDM